MIFDLSTIVGYDQILKDIRYVHSNNLEIS